MNRPNYDTLFHLFEECLHAPYRQVENGASYAVKRRNRHVTIFFEDSEGCLDWRNNFRFFKRPYCRMKEVWYCHRGFLSVFQAVLPYLLPIIADESVKEFTVVGYSHGAALALLCHEYIWYHRPDRRQALMTVAYGCPRVIHGRPAFLRERFENFFYVKNLDDLVTHLPPAILGYRHVKKPILIGERGKYSSVDAHRPEAYRHELLFGGVRAERREALYDG